MVKTLQILFFPSTPKFKNTVLCWCTAKCPQLFITLGESRKTPCSSNHMWHFATGDSQFEVGFLPFLWPNAATKMQKIASWEQAFVRVASGVYFEHAKPCNHNQVPISNTDGWIPLLFSPQPGVQPMYSVHVWRNSNDVSKCGRYWLLASLFQLQSPLQAGGSGKKKNSDQKHWLPPPPLSHYFSLWWDGGVMQSSLHWFPAETFPVSFSFYFSRLTYWQMKSRITAE